MLNITYKDRKTNIWVREKTKYNDILQNGKGKSGHEIWASHISRREANSWKVECSPIVDKQTKLR